MAWPMLASDLPKKRGLIGPTWGEQRQGAPSGSSRLILQFAQANAYGDGAERLLEKTYRTEYNRVHPRKYER